MEKSIEAIWKEGFLNEKSLVAPKINDLYNQKSKDLVDKNEKDVQEQLNCSCHHGDCFSHLVLFPGFVWQGIAISILMLLTVWYSKRQKRGIKTLDHGATSLDYLKSFDRLLKDALSKGEKVLRFTYPLYFLIAMSILWSAWNKGH
jgi:hypothetical protein